MAEALTGEWRNGLAPEEPEQVEEEEENPDLKRRDRSKQNKFNVLLAAGAVPADMRKEWEAMGSRVAKEPEQVHRGHGCSRRKNRSLGLELRQGRPGGLGGKTKTGWGDKGLSKTLFKGKFGLTDEMLRQAILDGVAFCQWRELKQEHMDERATHAKLSLDAKKLTGQQGPDGDAL